jgi:hypothetical protein
VCRQTPDNGLGTAENPRNGRRRPRSAAPPRPEVAPGPRRCPATGRARWRGR